MSGKGRIVGVGKTSPVCLPARCSHTDHLFGKAMRCPLPCAPFKAVCPAHSLPESPRPDEFARAIRMCLEQERRKF